MMAKKKKHKVPEICDEIAEPRDTGNPKEIVKTNKVKPVALENNSLESNLKEKTEKKKDKKGQMYRSCHCGSLGCQCFYS